MTMGNIECILDEVNNLSDSDLKILVNKRGFWHRCESPIASL